MNKELLPIGQRVTHFDGGPNTHGKGTIVAYNNIKPATQDLASFAKLLEEHDASSSEVKNIIAQGAVVSVYDGVRCPYVVHFDSSERFPEGYKDVYERESINAITEK